ncbi:MAG: DoxX family membrane protein [Pikeienuella sp.]|uniref:DoxX family membrane protein n=1 Tax=Pikeienuella sp. TaxID=2831957 RepID=UPI0039194152
MTLFATLRAAHDALFRAVESALGGWFAGTAARLVFAAVLFGYYWNSALTKVGDGLAGFFTISDGAYVQILPAQMEAAGYDSSQIATIPWGLIVAAGTYAEFLLPLLIVLGLLTRLAALGMIGFVIVQSYVDIAFHGADAATVGALFDRLPGAAIMDQRALWIFLLALLVVKGAGPLSLDAVLRRSNARTRIAPA